ncbi:unnamed protein product, partial [Onchocerca ochengi]|uniref:Kelch domain-containing protein 10 n=1 Tax=Onchocerca ochengi TaxID=42157 RepID=A0A182EV74_ONCOC
GESPPGREHHTACIIKEKMYIFGGTNGTDGEIGMDILNLETGSWETPEITGEIPYTVREPCSWVHHDKMYVFGGWRQRDSRHTSDLYRFDPERSIWHRMHPFGLRGPIGRQRHCGVIVEDRVFVFSGIISLIPYELNTDIGYILELCDLYVLNFNWTLKDLASLVVLHEVSETDFGIIPFDLESDIL